MGVVGTGQDGTVFLSLVKTIQTSSSIKPYEAPIHVTTENNQTHFLQEGRARED